MPVALLSEWRMTTRDWQEFAASGILMVEAATLANGGLLELLKVDCTDFRLVYHLHILGCWVLEDWNVMTLTLEYPLVISGKSLFVRILVHRLLNI